MMESFGCFSFKEENLCMFPPFVSVHLSERVTLRPLQVGLV